MTALDALLSRILVSRILAPGYGGIRCDHLAGVLDVEAPGEWLRATSHHDRADHVVGCSGGGLARIPDERVAA